MDRADTRAAQHCKRKLLYYRRWVETDEVKLRGVSRATEHDGDVDYYRKVLEGIECPNYCT